MMSLSICFSSKGAELGGRCRKIPVLDVLSNFKAAEIAVFSLAMWNVYDSVVADLPIRQTTLLKGGTEASSPN